MAFSLVKGLVSSKTIDPPSRIIVSGPHLENLRKFEALGTRIVTDNKDAVAGASTVLLCVKPHIMPDVLKDIGGSATPDHVFVSVAAGVPCQFVEERIAGHPRVIRVMPNTPALVGMGASSLSRGSYATDEDMGLAQRIMKSVGDVAVTLPERLLNAATGLAGSGPAYAFLFMEALSDGGVTAGLPRATATELAAQMLKGAAEMVLQTGKHPGELKDAVGSPAGTTMAGVRTLEKAGFRSAVIEAVLAATARGEELAAAAK
jgi:pyrroline-5-carboxylate reductase